jgi:hypothetical protein
MVFAMGASPDDAGFYALLQNAQQEQVLQVCCAEIDAALKEL